MYRYFLFLLTLTILCNTSVAIIKDSLYSPNKHNETIKEIKVLNTPDEVKSILSNTTNPVPSKNFSTEIVSFESNKIPVDFKLFKCHINTLDLEVQMDYNSFVKKQIDFLE